ncbi:TlpA family protein disulfide reductase [Candidatus Gottesmanbacteria bacterium]|nr:TlpA family protein disulfide reductase [Candidatus Gottesmanbacteria bacterium]
MRNKNIFIIATILLIGLAFFFGSKAGRVSNNKQDTSQILSDTKSAPTTLLNKQAPDFKLTTLDNQEFNLSDKRSKTIILFGMAGWCGTCIPEGRALTQVRKEYASRGVEVIGVAFTKGDNEDFLKEFRNLGTIDIPLSLDTDNVASKYQLVKLETTYIINKDGVIVYKDEQFTSYDDYKRELDKIL